MPVQDYDGTTPFPGTDRAARTAAEKTQVGFTLAIVIAPFVGLVAVAWLSWGVFISLADVLIAAVFTSSPALG